MINVNRRVIVEVDERSLMILFLLVCGVVVLHHISGSLFDKIEISRIPGPDEVRLYCIGEGYDGGGVSDRCGADMVSCYQSDGSSKRLSCVRFG